MVAMVRMGRTARPEPTGRTGLMGETELTERMALTGEMVLMVWMVLTGGMASRGCRAYPGKWLTRHSRRTQPAFIIFTK